MLATKGILVLFIAGGFCAGTRLFWIFQHRDFGSLGINCGIVSVVIWLTSWNAKMYREAKRADYGRPVSDLDRYARPAWATIGFLLGASIPVMLIV